MAQPGVPSDSSLDANQEKEQGVDKVSRAEKVVSKFSTYDGSTVEMMDPDISERTYTATTSKTDSLSLRP